MFHKNKMGSIIRSTGTVFYSLLYLNSRQGFNGLKYEYSVISVIIDSLLKIGNRPVRGRKECDFESWGGWRRVRFLGRLVTTRQKIFPQKTRNGERASSAIRCHSMALHIGPSDYPSRIRASMCHLLPLRAACTHLL